MRQKFVSLSLIFVLAWSAFAQQPQPRRTDDAAPSVERLREYISYLASDKLEGRRTGSAGATVAAEYIAREFARLHLRRSIGHDLPGMSILEADSPRRYMQEFPFVAGVELGKNNSMLLTQSAQTGAARSATSGAQASTPATASANSSLDLRLGEDWMPLGFSSNAKLASLPATFVHYGIKADELNYNDYQGAQVAGRVAVALGGTPDGDNPHGQFARYEDVRWKAIAARNSGAAALVVLSRSVNFRDDRLSRLSYDNSGGEAGLPVILVSMQAGERILEAGGLTLSQPPSTGRSALQVPKLIPAGQAAGEGAQRAALPLQNLTLSISTEIVRRNAPAFNVVGILDGSDPVLKNDAIVIGAHYDHLGLGGEGSLAPREGEVHHGADDNASGVAGLLELARIFSAERLKRSLVFIAFGGEEEGLLGSNFYVNHAIWPLDKTVAMINMDMIGRMKDNRLIIGGVGTAAEWRGLGEPAGLNPSSASLAISQAGNTSQPVGVPQASLSVNASLGGANRFALTLSEDGYGPSDHSSFYAKRIPVLFFWTGTHDDYHKPSDTADKINYEDEARILSLVAQLTRSLGMGATRPTYAVARSEAQGRSMAFRVYLGTIPNYSESNDGLRLDGVRADSPAAKAGLKGGDRIVKMAGRPVRNVYDYTYALGEMKAGEEYEVEIVRDGQTLVLKITPAARR